MWATPGQHNAHVMLASLTMVCVFTAGIYWMFLTVVFQVRAVSAKCFTTYHAMGTVDATRVEVIEMWVRTWTGDVAGGTTEAWNDLAFSVVALEEVTKSNDDVVFLTLLVLKQTGRCDIHIQMDQRISRRGENNLPSFGSMCILQYIACSICSYQCDKYTCLDIHIRAGVLVVEKDQILNAANRCRRHIQV